LENIAHEADCSVSTISRLERGETEVDAGTLAAIRVALGVENAPLLDHEIEHYASRMWLWNELIATWRTDDAKAMQKEMAVILDLPYERGNHLLYTQTEISLLLFDEENTPAVLQKMADAETQVDEMGTEARHLYYTNKGTIYVWQNNFKQALKPLITALDYKCDVFARQMPSLLTNISICYSRIGRMHNAVLYLERAKQAFDGDLTNPLGPVIDINLATCYEKIGELSKAKSMTNESLVHARRVNHETGIGVCYHILANIEAKKRDFAAAIKLYEQSFNHCKADISLQLQSVYDKTCCLYEAKNYSAFEKAAIQGQALAKDSEYFTLLFESCLHLLTLKDGESEYFIESTTIPTLSKRINPTFALFFCDKLEEHYKKKKSIKKALTIAAITRDIYKEMFTSEEMALAEEKV